MPPRVGRDAWLGGIITLFDYFKIRESGRVAFYTFIDQRTLLWVKCRVVRVEILGYSYDHWFINLLFTNLPQINWFG